MEARREEARGGACSLGAVETRVEACVVRGPSGCGAAEASAFFPRTALIHPGKKRVTILAYSQRFMTTPSGNTVT